MNIPAFSLGGMNVTAFSLVDFKNSSVIGYMKAWSANNPDIKLTSNTYVIPVSVFSVL